METEQIKGNGKYSLVIGRTCDSRKNPYTIHPEMSKEGRWVVNRSTENGLFFDTMEETEEFQREVVEFAKKLYADKQREKVEHEREQMIAEREQKYEEWTKKE